MGLANYVAIIAKELMIDSYMEEWRLLLNNKKKAKEVVTVYSIINSKVFKELSKFSKDELIYYILTKEKSILKILNLLENI